MEGSVYRGDGIMELFLGVIRFSVFLIAIDGIVET